MKDLRTPEEKAFIEDLDAMGKELGKNSQNIREAGLLFRARRGNDADNMLTWRVNGRREVMARTARAFWSHFVALRVAGPYHQKL